MPDPNLKEEVKKIISNSGMWVSCDFDEDLSQKEQDLMFDDLSVAITSLIYQKCQESYIKGMRRVIYQPFPHNKFEEEIDGLVEKGEG